ncbi:hypothetical protein N7493_008343 [Penicillium malachiteum]|uniref:BTB domain-containing protein n=1 Tax=Penicillium malachiteum TaxID=1324776 RepID=A0AAD6HHG8_9EURO|nr:hypothetical protein N7493_008343 [Penicillium malachiteum]
MESLTNIHPLPSIFKDCPLQALVGSEKTVHYIHPGALSCSNSEVLQARVQERWMKSDVNKVIDWTDFDEDTIQCVLNYLYTGTYDVLRQDSATEEDKQDEKEDKKEDRKETEQPALPDSPNAHWTRYLASHDSRAQEVHHEPVFEDLTGPLDRMLRTSPDLTTESEEESVAEPLDEKQRISDECLGNIALLHAKVYCFAHQYLFSELEDLACQHLKQILQKSDEPSDSFFTPLANAIHLVYNSTPAPSKKNPARRLLYRYVACKYLKRSTEVLDSLLAEGGDFAIDLARKLAKKAQAHRSCMENLETTAKALEFREINLLLTCTDPMSLWRAMNHL